MSIYDRIINILLEAKIESYLERLDEEFPVKKIKIQYHGPKKGKNAKPGTYVAKKQLGKSEGNLAKAMAKKAAKAAAKGPKTQAQLDSGQHAHVSKTSGSRGRPRRTGSRKSSAERERADREEEKRRNQASYDPDTKSGAGSGGYSAGQRNT